MIAVIRDKLFASAKARGELLPKLGGVTTVYRFGPFEVNTASGELLRQGVRVRLQEQPLRLLLLLLENAGELVPHGDIQRRIWENNTFVEFDSSLRVAIRKLREALGDDANHPHYIETIPRKGYRFLGTVVHSESSDSQKMLIGEKSDQLTVVAAGPALGIGAQMAKGWRIAMAAGLAVIALTIGAFFYYSHRTPALTERDTIVLADFNNKTGDPVFDDTLKQALTVQLEQSPFLNVLPTEKVTATLRLMGRDPGTRLTEQVARDVCQRTGSKAMLGGSVVSLGNHYVIGLSAINCATGDSLATEQADASGKEEVLKVVSRAANDLRARLGESLISVQRFGTAVEEATTPSLEALKAYSLGMKAWRTKGETAALPFFKRAVELDPTFASAYDAMGTVYANISEAELGSQNVRKAFELRGKVSERERFHIESNYYENVTGELDKALQLYQVWQQTYPDRPPYGLIADVYRHLGKHAESLRAWREALRLDPNSANVYDGLFLAYIYLDRVDEAKALFKQAKERNIESEYLLIDEYWLAWLHGDVSEMSRLPASVQGKPGEHLMLVTVADTEGWYGRMRRAWELTRQAVESAKRNDAKEAAANYLAVAVLREAETGNRQHARAAADAALKLAVDPDVVAVTAMGLAQAGETTRAEELALELNRRFPLNTFAQHYWLPTIRAVLEVKRKNPKKAIELLREATAYEFGVPTQLYNVALCPIYVRGQAFLTQGNGVAATAEFQKFLDHRGLVVNFPLGALARLQLGRAYAMAGDTAKAKTAYQDFLTLWKDADLDIPILKQAKAEYADLE